MLQEIMYMRSVKTKWNKRMPQALPTNQRNLEKHDGIFIRGKVGLECVDCLASV